MVKSELVDALHKNHPEITLEECGKIVDLFFGEIVGRLADGGRVELRGFGAFSTRRREAKNGRNPRTGASVAVPAKHAIHFKPGRSMHGRLNKANATLAEV